jgi:hypothetical protein
MPQYLVAIQHPNNYNRAVSRAQIPMPPVMGWRSEKHAFNRLWAVEGRKVVGIRERTSEGAHWSYLLRPPSAAPIMLSSI